MKAEIIYINECGLKGKATINNPDSIHHVWWSGKKNFVGKYEKHEVTVLQAFMKKLKNCKVIKFNVYAD